MADFNWDDLRVLLALDRCGTLLSAARQLGVSHSTVARRLAAAEGALQVRLFHRRGQSLVRSEAAEEVLTHAQRIEEEIASFSRSAGGADARLEGEVRVTAPLALLTHFLAPHLPAFRETCPGITVTMFGDLSLDSLLQGEIDLGLRISRPVSDRLDIRRINECRFALYGTPALAARIRQAGGLGGVPYLQTTGQEMPMPEALWMSVLFGEQPPAMKAGTMPLLLAAALAGVGVTALPCFLGDPQAGLVRIPVQPEGPREKVFVVTKREQRGVARVRALVNFIDRAARAERARFAGEAEAA
ncbi:LysR family transcriptional regulator [Roseomonas sp. GC11]|uniref:LysR family transcriptional regulator n=1 Tax=Roseomonas sp. GC11 TaxID=2950546 RepID=UPI00210CCD36|nr:LysR family transcriptional regulator [Roseomonas sp. GC11]